MFLLPHLLSHLTEPTAHRAARTSSQVIENKDSTLILIELPGAQAEQLKVELSDELLSVALTPSAGLTPPEGKQLWQEFALKPTSLRYRVPPHYDREALSATLRDGLLTIELKRSAPVVKQIKVATSSDQAA